MDGVADMINLICEFIYDCGVHLVQAVLTVVLMIALLAGLLIGAPLGVMYLAVLAVSARRMCRSLFSSSSFIFKVFITTGIRNE
jgi:Na+/H+ antiporter NhaA